MVWAHLVVRYLCPCGWAGRMEGLRQSGPDSRDPLTPQRCPVPSPGCQLHGPLPFLCRGSPLPATCADSKQRHRFQRQKRSILTGTEDRCLTSPPGMAVNPNSHLVAAPGGSLQQVSMVCVPPEMPAEIRDLSVHSSLTFWKGLLEVGPNILNTFPKGLQNGSMIIVLGGEK